MTFKKLKHKYNAKPQLRDGHRFASKLEMRYAGILDMNKKAGELLFYLRQPRFDLPGGVKYYADFIEFWKNGDVVITDCKGVDTPVSNMKIKQVEEIYPVNIQIIRKV